MVPWMALLLVMLSANRALTLDISVFSNEVICSLDARITNGCSKEKTVGFRSKLECVTMCARDSSCIGASLDDTGNKCFHHLVCPIPMTCTQTGTKHNYSMSRSCVHGTWDSTTKTCKCVNGCTGTRCEKYPKDCRALMSPDFNYPKGNYRIFIDPLQDVESIIEVMCSIEPPSYFNIKTFANKGKINFNRTFHEYENGFHVDEFNMWLGLRPWHILSEAGCKTFSVVMAFYQRSNVVYRKHRGFAVAGKESGYAFTFSRSNPYYLGYKPPGAYAGDCLAGLQNKRFSTWDNGVDGDSEENCASRAGSGWWYAGCDGPCNLLGWGLEDYANTPIPQRLSMAGVHVGAEKGIIYVTESYLEC